MKPETRLTISWGIVIGSILYAVLVVFNQDLAASFAWWYVPVVLTLLLIAAIGKRRP